MRALRRASVGPIVLLLVAVPTAHAAGLSVASGDGVRMAMASDGTISGMTVGSRALRTVGPGGFSLRKVGGTPNLVPNAGMELDANSDGVPDGWIRTTTPTVPVIDHTVAHTGGRSLRLRNTVLGYSGTLRRDIAVKPLTEYSVSVWMRSDAVLPNAPSALTYSAQSPARLLVQQLAGTTIVANGYAYGYTDTADWNRQFLGIRTLSGVTAVRLTMRILQGTGTVWYDDLALTALLQPGSVPVRGSVTAASGGTLRQHAVIPGEELTLDATYSGASDRITVDGTVSSTSTRDGPLQVEFTVPIDATGWRWHDNARTSHTIEAGRSYAYDTRWHVQAMSRYPWGTVGDTSSSLSIGIPLSVPRIARVRYTPAGLTISFDLGLSPAATRLGNAATFRFVLFTSDPAWGYRAATAKYYALYPDAFVRRTDPAREGGWVQRKYLGAWADRVRDFGLGLDMLALGSDQDGADNNDAYLLAADNADGVYTTGYNHHWGYKLELGSRDHRPTYEQAVGLLQTQAAGATVTEPQQRAVDIAKATLASTARDYNGRYAFERYDAKQGQTYLQWYEDLDPLSAADVDWETVSKWYQVDRAIANAAAVGGRLDGIHFDSTSGMRRWGAQDDYARSHWAAALEPLTFSYDSGQVALRIAFTDYGEIVRTAAFLHARGMILSANFNGSEARAGSWFGADMIDYFGIEQGLPEKTGEGDIYVTLDGFALYKRTIADQRPLTTLDPLLGQGALSTAEVERRLRLNLFYGIYAGIGGTQGQLTEAIRQLYLRYTPLFRAIDAAGWEPVTLARSTDSQVWLERYGSLSDGAVYLALRNDTTVARTTNVNVDFRGAGAPVGALRARELIGDTAITVTTGQNGERAAFSRTVGPGDTALVRITRAP